MWLHGTMLSDREYQFFTSISYIGESDKSPEFQDKTPFDTMTQKLRKFMLPK